MDSFSMGMAGLMQWSFGCQVRRLVSLLQAEGLTGPLDDVLSARFISELITWAQQRSAAAVDTAFL